MGCWTILSDEGIKGFNSQKKFIKMYISNFKGANELRMRLMECGDVGSALEIIKSLL